jgi:RES domain-containing protein
MTAPKPGLSGAATWEPPARALRWPGAHRLIPSRYPTAGILDRVASEDDLAAVIALEGWTNDRLSVESGRLHVMPRDEWVVGQPMATVVMAAFCHPRPGGGRFNGPSRGAWYASRELETAIAETVYHRTRELDEIGCLDARVEMREYLADFDDVFHDVRRGPATMRFHHPADYTDSQALAARLLDARSSGIVYRSVRHAGGECLACFRPRLVRRVRVGAHFEYRWEGTREPRVIRLAAKAGRASP